jgi:hypothetical protein
VSEQVSPEAIIQEWELLEGESMREGHRATLERLIGAALHSRDERIRALQEIEGLRDEIRLLVLARDIAESALSAARADAQQWLDAEPDWKTKYETALSAARAEVEARAKEGDQERARILDLRADLERERAEREEAVKALGLLLSDLRNIQPDEPPERMIPVQHRVSDIRQALRASRQPATPVREHVHTYQCADTDCEAVVGPGAPTEEPPPHVHTRACYDDQIEKLTGEPPSAPAPHGEPEHSQSCRSMENEYGLMGCTEDCPAAPPSEPPAPVPPGSKTLEERAAEMADMALAFLSKLPPEERRRRIDAFVAAAEKEE